MEQPRKQTLNHLLESCQDAFKAFTESECFKLRLELRMTAFYDYSNPHSLTSFQLYVIRGGLLVRTHWWLRRQCIKFYKTVWLILVWVLSLLALIRRDYLCVTFTRTVGLEYG